MARAAFYAGWLAASKMPTDEADDADPGQEFDRWWQDRE